jgi:aspartate ammonia-lyase
MMIPPIALIGSISTRIREFIAKKAQDRKKTIRETMLQERIPEGEVGRILDLKRMTRGRKLQKAPS